MRYFDAMETPSTRLRQARENAGYESASDAAEALDLKYATYVQHENGTRGFRAGSAERYAKKFRTSVEWLLFGKQPPQQFLPRQLMLPVSLPDHDRLVTMVRALLKGVGLPDVAAEHAEELARRLPDALALAVSDLDAEELSTAAIRALPRLPGARRDLGHS